MKSGLYKGQVMHHRQSPVKHAFQYGVFFWGLDLDDLGELKKRNPLTGYNQRAIYSLRDSDHLLGDTSAKSLKDNAAQFLRQKGVTWADGSMYLITNLRTFGHLFNPVSFYFCQEKHTQKRYCIVEVGNTYYEMKPYLLEETQPGYFDHQVEKLFYVSPFTELTDHFHFKIHWPTEKLQIQIDDLRQGDRFFLSTVKGTWLALNSRNILWSLVSYPFHTIKVIWAIHWQAFRLWIKKVPYQAKAANPNWQTEVQRKHKSIEDISS
jgi:uncharacterized protein